MRASSEHGILVTGSYDERHNSCVPIIRFSRLGKKTVCLSIESDRIRVRSAHGLLYPRERKPLTVSGAHSQADVLLWCTSLSASELRVQLLWMLEKCKAAADRV
jgi:hypothetical protein